MESDKNTLILSLSSLSEKLFQKLVLEFSYAKSKVIFHLDPDSHILRVRDHDFPSILGFSKLLPKYEIPSFAYLLSYNFELFVDKTGLQYFAYRFSDKYFYHEILLLTEEHMDHYTELDILNFKLTEELYPQKILENVKEDEVTQKKFLHGLKLQENIILSYFFICQIFFEF
jgi:hypothetical protein